MAATWTTLTSHTTGELVTASAYNALFGPTGNLAFLYAGQGAAASVSAQSIDSGAATKAALATEAWDPLGWFDASTNYRFQPNIAGQYGVMANTYGATVSTFMGIYIYLNGAFAFGHYSDPVDGNDWALSINASYNLNGSSDYLEIYILHSSGSSKTFNTHATFWRLGS